MVAVELLRPDGTKEVRLVPKDSIPAGAVVLPNQPGADPSNVSSSAASRAASLRPIHKGLTVTRKGSFAGTPVSTKSGGVGSRPGAAPGSGQGGSGGTSESGPTLGTEGADPGVGSSWRPVGPRGGGAGSTGATPTALFTVDKNTGGGVIVKWFDPSTDSIKSTIQRQTREGLTSWGPTREFSVGPTLRVFNDRPGAGVHRYRVAGVNRVGTSPFTDWVSIEIAATVPNSPSDLEVSSMPPRLSWSDNSDNESRFEIEREKQSGAQWGSAADMTVSADSTGAVDAPGNGHFRYRLRAVNELGASAFTDWVEYAVQDTPPNAPADLTLIGFDAGNKPRLVWVDNSSNEASFELERQTQSGAQWTALVSTQIGADTTTVVDNPGQGTFRYRLRAVNGSGTSAFTPYTVVTVADGLPSTPGNFAAVDGGDGTTISITWLDTSSNESGFEIQRERQSGQTWIQGLTLNPQANTVAYNDGPGAGVFRYRIRAVNAVGPSPYSAWAVASVVSAPPSTPEGVVASDMGTRRALFSWTYEKFDVSGFDLERSPAFSSGTVSVDSSVHGYVDPCGPGVFSYRVRAVGPSGASQFSNWASVTVSEIPPAAPSDLVATDTGSQNQIRLLWTDNSSNEAAFRLQRQTMQPDGSWGLAVDLANVGADVVQTIDAPATGKHRYRVCSTNAAGDSAWTLWITASLSTGWTPLVPSADTRIVYVSSSTGNDSNSGLSEGAPVRTILRGYSLLRHKSADWLLLKAGDTWKEGFPYWQLCGRSATEPMVISSYGVGERPRIDNAPDTAAFPRSGGGGSPPSIDHIWLVGIAFSCSAYKGDTQTLGFAWNGAGSNILIEDCLFQGYLNNISIQGSAADPVKNVTIRRSVIIDAYSKESNGHAQGIITGFVDGLNIIENVIDHNGWKEGVGNATIFNHNMYITSDNSNAVVRGNIITRASSHGLALGCGGVVEENLFVRDALAGFVGKVASTVRNNVVLEGTDIAADIPRGFGFEIQQVPMSPPTIVENNIIANKLSPNTYASALNVGFSTNPAYPPPGAIIFRNNIVYNWKAVGFNDPVEPDRYGSVTVSNNVFSEPSLPSRMVYHSPTSVDTARITFTGNTYNYVGNSPFAVGGYDVSLAQWKTMTKETNLSTAPRIFAGASNTTASYNASLGGQATFEAYINECRKQSRLNWRDAYTAAAFNAYMRDGFK